MAGHPITMTSSTLARSPHGDAASASAADPRIWRDPATLALDLMRMGVVLLDARWDVVFANRLAQEVLGKSDVLAVRNGRLIALKSRDTRAIRDCLQQCLVSRKRQVLTLDRLHGGRPVILTFVAVDAPNDDLAAGRFMMFICDLEHRKALVSTELVRQALNLTETEASVAVHLCDGLSISDVANVHGISVGTARNHLKRIFSKLGIGRQSELVIYLMDTVGYLAPETGGLGRDL